MNKDFIPIRLREARKMCGYSLDQLVKAAKLNITRQCIYNYERGVMQPKTTVAKALADTLGVSISYFYGETMKIDMPSLRSTGERCLTEDEKLQIEVQLSYWAERYLLKEKKVGIKTMFTNPLANTIISTFDDIILATDRLRETWNCGSGPIPAVLRLIERKGIKVLSEKLPDGIWGLSTYADNCHPLLVVDMRPEKTTTDRYVSQLATNLPIFSCTFLMIVILKKCAINLPTSFSSPNKPLLRKWGANTANV